MKRHLLLLVSAAALFAADATGTWTGTFTPEGGNEGPAVLVLKPEGKTVTGTAGPNESDRYQISNGKVSGDDLTFEVSTGNSVMKFALKQSGDEIKGEASRERDGQKQTAKIAVKRQK